MLALCQLLACVLRKQGPGASPALRRQQPIRFSAPTLQLSAFCASAPPLSPPRTRHHYPLRPPHSIAASSIRCLCHVHHHPPAPGAWAQPSTAAAGPALQVSGARRRRRHYRSHSCRCRYHHRLFYQLGHSRRLLSLCPPGPSPTPLPQASTPHLQPSPATSRPLTGDTYVPLPYAHATLDIMILPRARAAGAQVLQLPHSDDDRPCVIATSFNAGFMKSEAKGCARVSVDQCC